ncbi:probable phosphorylase b kinase regulatory subunit beta isoform X3 [Hyalella azteca]|uniref:Phosphorylase b kinase regulatory subunit n=1 Tax=Hyalella azteca TaxID=294128 RepID=A0A979FX07_HYAAZ|nr:probable phosphorylase b kinase regulatory subunit beta isoform X3 [Hyalella azteca]
MDVSSVLVHSTNYKNTVRQLDYYYGVVKRQILHYQSPTNGLFPACSSDTHVADLRTSVYCSMAIWSLYQSYRRIDDDHGKAYELGGSCVKCMRGILSCWMRQSERVELFKQGQAGKYALHSKFHLITGEEVCSTGQFEHLQLDVIAVYLIALVQLTASGLHIIYTMDEVAFVQNLVYYIERSYRTPDFGIWERGSKNNDGTPELHASSIGMVKAALEAINGCNLFGDRGASWSVIFVDIDAHNRNRSIFETLLPKESNSKNVDASLLFALSFPSFATHDTMLYSTTKERIVRLLKGSYGFKRFERDGFGSVLEDKTRRHYHKGETKEFEGVECEWPMFLLLMVIEGVFKNNEKQIEEYRSALKQLYKTDKNGDVVVPKYYYVPKDYIELEREQPGTQLRMASVHGSATNLFLMGQSLFLIAELLTHDLLHINELDPIRRYLPSYNRPRKGGRYSAFQMFSSDAAFRPNDDRKGTASDLVVQVVLIAESMRLQAMMATYGIQTQTPHEVEPVQIWPPKELVKVYCNLGLNKKLGLNGRPMRPIGALGTSKVYRICGQTVLCYPLVFEVSDFYLSHDMALLIDNIKTELHFVSKYWRLSGRPTVCILIREEHMRDIHFRELLDLLASLKSGHCDGLKVRTGRLQNLISSSCVEHLDFMSNSDVDWDVQAFEQLQHASIGYQSLTDVPQAIAYAENKTDFRDMEHSDTWTLKETLRSVTSLRGRTQLLGMILAREGPDHQLDGQSVAEKITEVLGSASSLRLWSVVRTCTALLSKEVESISPYITTVLVYGKQVTLGSGNNVVVLDKPVQPGEVHDLFYTKDLKPSMMVHAVLQQEVMLYCGKLMGAHPHLFKGILNIRVAWLVQAMEYYHQSVLGKNEVALEELSPNEVFRLLVAVLSMEQEDLSPRQMRFINGCLGRTPANFYDKVWLVLQKTPGGLSLLDRTLPQQPTISELSPTEMSFAKAVQELLGAVQVPEYNQVVAEALRIIATILQRNPELQFSQAVKLESLVRDAAHIMRVEQRDEDYTTASYFNTGDAKATCPECKCVESSCVCIVYHASSPALNSCLARAIVNLLLAKDTRTGVERAVAGCKVS